MLLVTHTVIDQILARPFVVLRGSFYLLFLLYHVKAFRLPAWPEVYV